ncbi:P-selectin glycoprotein ligand 1-like [Penaeus indicus]|uniref:P-selectin glycoprotein ligand 1-like n=1 Tax=Penaeus indicus TaxID=29960 RepID=UPI00300C71EC
MAEHFPSAAAAHCNEPRTLITHRGAPLASRPLSAAAERFTHHSTCFLSTLRHSQEVNISRELTINTVTTADRTPTAPSTKALLAPGREQSAEESPLRRAPPGPDPVILITADSTTQPMATHWQPTGNSTNLNATQLPSTQPLATQLPSTQPLATQLTSTQPLATQLTSTQPLATQLTSTQPLATQLTSTQPLATQLTST